MMMMMMLVVVVVVVTTEVRLERETKENNQSTIIPFLRFLFLLSILRVRLSLLLLLLHHRLFSK